VELRGRKLLLESIVHPAVFGLETRIMEEFRQSHPDAVAVFDAALLIESGAYTRMDKVVVVWCSPETQMQRLTGPKGLDPAEAGRRIAAQMPLAEKLVCDEALFERIVREAFGARRKILRNALPLAPQDYAALGIDPKLRPENLAPADYVRIAKRVSIADA